MIPTKRPTGVTIIATVLFIFAGLFALSAVGMALPSFDPGDLPPEFQDLSIPPELFSKALAVAFVIFAAIFAAIGAGLLLLKNWVRIIAIVLGGIKAFLGGIQVLAMAAAAQDMLLLLGLAELAAVIFAIWYLLQPSVKAAFMPAPTGPQAPQASPQAQPEILPSSPSTSPPTPPTPTPSDDPPAKPPETS